MNIIEAIKKYFTQYEMIQSEANGEIGVDFLKDKGVSFSIEPLPVNPIVKNYIGSGGERQYAFVLSATFDYSAERQMNVENSGFFEELQEWIEEQNYKDNLPQLGEGKEATKLEVTSNGYLFGISKDMRSGRYQMQFRLLYEVE